MERKPNLCVKESASPATLKPQQQRPLVTAEQARRIVEALQRERRESE